MPMKRRRFIAASTAAAAAIPFLSNRRVQATSPDQLIPDPAEVPILDLPEGFTYSIVEASLDPADPLNPSGRGVMSDGYLMPGAPDGMACYEGPDGTWILMRNHELISAALLDDGLPLPPGSPVGAGALASPFSGGQGAPPESFDPGNDDAIGGVSRVVVRPLAGGGVERVSSNLVLCGSWQNCAGGPTPWGSWLSCEETTDDPAHGFVFECPITADSVVDARSMQRTNLGRFSHEAAAVDPSTNIIYLTEDRGNSVLYRHVPDDPDAPLGAGRLQAMRIVGDAGVRTADWGPDEIGVWREIDWIDLDGIDSPDDDLRERAAAAGAAVISRGEGIAFDGSPPSEDVTDEGAGGLYVVSTNGGPDGKGQIFRVGLDEAGEATGFQLVAVGTGEDVLDRPDNVVVAPWGDVYLCEDGPDDQFIRVLKPNGEIHTLARNAMQPFNPLLAPILGQSEFAGACFSPDGSTLFANIQFNGVTVAIQGPFQEIGANGSGGGGGCSIGGTPAAAATGISAFFGRRARQRTHRRR